MLRETSHTEKANTAGPHLYVESGLNTNSSKFKDAPNLSALSDLDFLHKPEMKRRTISHLADIKGMPHHAQSLKTEVERAAGF